MTAAQARATEAVEHCEHCGYAHLKTLCLVAAEARVQELEADNERVRRIGVAAQAAREAAEAKVQELEAQQQVLERLHTERVQELETRLLRPLVNDHLLSGTRDA